MTVSFSSASLLPQISPYFGMTQAAATPTTFEAACKQVAAIIARINDASQIVRIQDAHQRRGGWQVERVNPGILRKTQIAPKLTGDDVWELTIQLRSGETVKLCNKGSNGFSVTVGSSPEISSGPHSLKAFDAVVNAYRRNSTITALLDMPSV